ncbi:PA3371 family protein [Aquipseudomonas ullengensis]|uniref:Uncharacterized protein n=1 Tax=Aquipseudomonas ullengensis TaxID=2759166 RepID=A0A7W4LJM2_9GAMM|nr:PA3371 family protein [Pseudomonas ullengensis]MBB2494380.1 hypothetical protein [Pseudomonas ullengensis]
MSKSALVLLVMTLLSVAALWLAPALDAELRLLLKLTGAVSAVLCTLALMAGRRIKFDPILR